MAEVLKTKNNMKKESSFKLKSGNKPSFAKLSGVQKSPMKKNGDTKKTNPNREESISGEGTRRVNISSDADGIRRPGGKVTKKKDLILSKYETKDVTYTTDATGNVIKTTTYVDHNDGNTKSKKKIYKKGTSGYKRAHKRAQKITDKSRKK